MKSRLFLLLFLSCASLAQDGSAIYSHHCASCHDSPRGRTPSVATLRSMSNGAILRSLEDGLMRQQAKDLNSQERLAVARYLSGGVEKEPQSPVVTTARCSVNVIPPQSAASWNGFGASITNLRFQSSAAAGLNVLDVPRLRLRWAFGLGDVTNARGQPVISTGRLFIASGTGKIYAVDPKSGCIYWDFLTEAPVRSGVMVSDTAGPAVFFGDARANAYAVDAATGKLLWKVHIEDHPAAVITDAPNYYQGTVYMGVSSAEEFLGADPKYECCKFRGSVVALDAATGKTIWKTYTIAETPKAVSKTKTGVQRWGPSGAAVWSTPTIDVKRNVVYVATGDNYSDPPTSTSDAVLALDRATGAVLWSQQMTARDAFTVDCLQPVKTNCPDSNGPDFDFGQPPVLASLQNGKEMLVIGQKSGVAYALDPDSKGKILWQTRVGRGGALGGLQWGSAADEHNMYVALSDIAFRQVSDPEHPGAQKGELDPTKGGGVFALDLRTGEKVWSAAPAACGTGKNCSPAQPSAVSGIPGAIFAGSVDGHFRAYSTATGEVTWDFDTAREYDTVNGQKARGGAIDGGGASIAGGMVYVYSGYGQWGGVPGNVLLAFGVEGK
ncbi:MAG TPA: PQQ-binding-like beta-propeller repeat protein [Candidatus Sulfotelmatobacter sp.]|nr:PQQ-binding-like beta-propeller repeat protein [Candidatus Sulfotelmatobacter sp.]